VESRSYFKIGSTEQTSRIDHWFASMAWNLGCQAIRSPHFRHHFFRFSYKFFLLTNPSQADTAVVGQIETAMVASMLAALKVEKEDRSLFQAALETAGEFLQLIKEPQQLRLVHLIEMKLLVHFLHLGAFKLLI
jgi:hypothetical protein